VRPAGKRKHAGGGRSRYEPAPLAIKAKVKGRTTTSSKEGKKIKGYAEEKSTYHAFIRADRNGSRPVRRALTRDGARRDWPSQHKLADRAEKGASQGKQMTQGGQGSNTLGHSRPGERELGKNGDERGPATTDGKTQVAS